MKATIPAIKRSLETPLLRSVSILIALALNSLALAQTAQAVSPPPDGGYPGGNTAEGQSALLRLTSGVYNTAVGLFSLESNATGNGNTAIGAGALFAATADQNTATGFGPLFINSTGEANAAHGAFALFSNTDGSDNTAVGDEALFNNTNGENNTGVGTAALSVNTAGFSNTAIGHNALGNNMTGSGNTGLGENAGFNVTTASNVICIGSFGGENIDNSCFIGNICSNVQPVIGTDPDYVTIDSNGRLGRSNLNGSSRRFKHDIQPMDIASEVIFTLKPVSFRYNKEYDAMQRIAFGLIAEEVAEVAPDLAGRNKNGEPDSVRYEQISAMLLNEFLKEHKKVEGQQETIIELKSTVAQQRKDFETIATRQQNTFQSKFSEQEKQIQALASDLQKVSAQLEVSKPTPQTVVNNP